MKDFTREQIEEIFTPITDAYDGKEYYDFDKEVGDKVKTMVLKYLDTQQEVSFKTGKTEAIQIAEDVCRMTRGIDYGR